MLFEGLGFIYREFTSIPQSNIPLIKKKIWKLIHKQGGFENFILYCLRYRSYALLMDFWRYIGIKNLHMFNNNLTIIYLMLFYDVYFGHQVFRCSNLWDILNDICLEIYDSLPCGGESVGSESSEDCSITSLPQSIPRAGTPVLENDLIESSSSCGSSDLDSEVSSLFPEYGFEYSKEALVDFPYGVSGSSSSEDTITSFNSSQATIEGSDFYQRYLSQDSINTIKSVSVPYSEHDYDCLSQHSEGWYPNHSYDYVDFNRNPNYHPYLDVDNPIHPYHDIDSDNVNEL
jgi:hypothetical protein